MFWDKWFKKKDYKNITDVPDEDFILQEDGSAPFPTVGEYVTSSPSDSTDEPEILTDDSLLEDLLDSEFKSIQPEALNLDQFKEDKSSLEQSDNEDEMDISLENFENMDDLFSNLDENEDLQASLDQVFYESEALSSEQSLNQQIADAIARDQASADSIKLNEEPGNFINDIATFDIEDIPIIEDLPAEESGIMQMVNKIPTKILIAVAAVIFIVSFMLISAMVAMVISNNRQKKAMEEKGTMIAQPSTATNNANYIYVSVTEEFKGENLTVSKILIDSTTTIFYFNKYFNALDYDIVLSDEHGSIYNLDFNYLKRYSSDDMYYEPTVLHFEPIDNNVRELQLDILDSITGETAQFRFVLKGNIYFPPVKYMVTSEELLADNDLYSLKIENITFSSAGSKVNFSLNWEDENSSLQLGSSSSNDLGITMREGYKAVQPQNVPVQYLFNDKNTILGFVDFAPARDLQSHVELLFNEVYKKYDVNQDIPALELFPSENSERVIMLDNYKLVLEHAFSESGLYIMVMHTEDMNIYETNNFDNESDNRVETKLDIELIVENNGVQISIPGECTSSNIGTDIVFDMNSNPFISDRSTSNIFFRINSALIKLENLQTGYNLSQMRNTRSVMDTNALKVIEDAFHDRLAYKSGEIDLELIDSFSPELISNPELMRNYTPANSSQDYQYTVKIITYSIDEDEMMAVISETWRPAGGLTEAPFYRTHKVIANNLERGWIITDDQIIK